MGDAADVLEQADVLRRGPAQPRNCSFPSRFKRGPVRCTSPLLPVRLGLLPEPEPLADLRHEAGHGATLPLRSFRRSKRRHCCRGGERPCRRSTSKTGQRLRPEILRMRFVGVCACEPVGFTKSIALKIGQIHPPPIYEPYGWTIGASGGTSSCGMWLVVAGRAWSFCARLCSVMLGHDSGRRRRLRQSSHDFS